MVSGMATISQANNRIRQGTEIIKVSIWITIKIKALELVIYPVYTL